MTLVSGHMKCAIVQADHDSHESLQVDIAPTRSHYQVDENISFQVRSNQLFHLYLIHVDRQTTPEDAAVAQYSSDHSAIRR